jgi:hypothetical protein
MVSVQTAKAPMALVQKELAPMELVRVELALPVLDSASLLQALRLRE